MAKTMENYIEELEFNKKNQVQILEQKNIQINN